MEQDPFRRAPVLDMTPEGEFRDPPPRPATRLDGALGRVGGVALLVALAAGALVLAALALVAIGVLLPVLLVAGLVAFGTLWWRRRRAGLRSGAPIRFVVIRR
jgi:hypothetical protein